MSDALSGYNFSSGSSGLWVDEFPVKLRVLTTDPLVHVEAKYGSTKFAFVVFNHDAGKAQILDRGASIAEAIQKLHLDEDYGADVQKIDIKISKTGEGKDTRYSVTPLPKAIELTNEQIKEATTIDLPGKIKNGVRMSAINNGADTPMPLVVVTDAIYQDVLIEDFDEAEPVNLADIPF